MSVMKSFILCIFLSLSCNLFASRPALPGVSVPGGSVSGNLSVNTKGKATYKIPIVVPPGTAGMQPDLALIYNSGSKNGIVGMGWKIAGISSIHRCPKTVAQDGVKQGVTYTAADRFCINGQKLKLINGNYGESGSEYRTEIDTFSKITAFGRSGDGPSRFVVQTKSGRTLYYGHTEFERLEVLGSETIRIWSIAKIEDPRLNSIDIQYIKNKSDGEIFPSRIDYTSNPSQGLAASQTVRFSYEERPDKVTKYAGESKIRLLRRLTKIETYFQEALVKSYRLSYQQGPSTGASRLVKIFECDNSSKCMNPTTFTWQDGVKANEVINEKYSQRLQFTPAKGDFDGDGKMDFFVLHNFGGFYICPDNRRFGWSDLHPDCQLVARDDQEIGPSTYRPHTGDFDGDGITDLYLIGKRNNLFCNLKTKEPSSVYQCVQTATDNFRDSYKTHTGDFNADGYNDLYLIGSTESLFCAGPGIAVSNNCISTVSSNWKDNFNVLPGDFNKDGFLDLYLLGTDSNYFCAGPRITQENNCISTGNINWKDNYIPALGDFNGDGYSDLYLVHKRGQEHYFCAGPGITHSNSCITTASGNWLTPYELGLPQTGDFNADGITDILFVPPLYWDYHDYNPSIVDKVCLGPQISMRNNCVNYNSNHARQYHGQYVNSTMPSPYPLPKSRDLLTHVTDGRGLLKQITYDYLSNPDIYIREPEDNFSDTLEIRSINGRIPVVSQITTPNGIDGLLHTKYHYTGLKNDVTRGSLGFSSITTTEVERNKVTKTDYRQDYPYIGQPATITVSINGKAQSVKEITYKNRLLNNEKSIFVYATLIDDTLYKLNGELLNRSIKILGYDNYGNQRFITTMTPDDRYQQVEHYSYQNNTVSWLLGLKKTSEITNSAPGKTPLTKHKEFSYNAYGEIVQEADNWSTNIGILTDYHYDAYGNIINKTSYAKGGRGSQSDSERITRYTYDNFGRFIITETNTLDHTTQFTYNQGLGLLKSQTDPNGLTVNYTYDSFGRLKTESYADGTSKHYDFKACLGHGGATNCYDSMGAYRIRLTETGKPDIIKSYDKLNREIYTHQQGFNVNEPVWSRTYYDELGRVSILEDVSGAVTTEYDARNRVTQITQADGSLSTIVYDGFNIFKINDLLQKTEESVNRQGLLVKVVDANGQIIKYNYDVHGDPILVEKPNGVTIVNTYDLRGNKLTSNDPDLGFWQYSYDGRGFLQTQTDAKNQVTEYYYDKLERLITRVEPDLVSSWEYDTAIRGANTTWVGALSKVSTDKDTSRRYHYDAYGRTAQVDIDTDASYSIKQSYDQQGRPSELTYPTGFKVRQEYNTNGYLSELKNAANDQSFWLANEVNFQGLISKESYGNGLVIEHGYHPQNKRMEWVKSSRPDNTLLQHQVFQYDSIGNLESRNNQMANINENYAYDNINRLITAEQNGNRQQVNYNVSGNITFKSNTGAYEYNDPDHVHAVTNTATGSFSYDANGNLTKGTGVNWSIQWNANNKPIKIMTTDQTRKFIYDANRQRIKQMAPGFSISYINNDLAMAGNYEKEVIGSQTIHRHFLTVNGAPIGEYLIPANGSHSTHYYHTDHLGSITEVTNSQGHLISRFHVDAWGKSSAIEGTNNSTRRRFTGHEQLDDDIIHMNGRIYHAGLGRMLSADPILQAPKNLQSHNRYSYVMNNPLRYLDPTGFVSFECSDDGCTLTGDPTDFFGDTFDSFDTYGFTGSYTFTFNDDNTADFVGYGIDILSIGLTAFDLINTPIYPLPDAVFIAAGLQTSKQQIKKQVVAFTRSELKKMRKRFAPKGARPPNLSPLGAGRKGAFKEAKRQSGIPVSQQPSRVLPNLGKRGKAQPGKVYEFDVPVPGGGTKSVRIRDDAGGHNFGAGNSQNRSSHFNDEAGNHFDY